MVTVAVELNDVGILAAGAGLRWQGRSPGFAMLDGGRILVGAEAVSRARLRPKWVESRFWDRLDSEPLGRPFPRHLSHADLVHAHLAEVWKSIQEGTDSRSVAGIDAVVLTVPGIYSNHQLGLILGIGRACGMPIAGMVDAAVAAGAVAAEADRVLHLDVLLHRMVLTELRQKESLARLRVESDKNSGLSAMMDLWAKLIASRFVHQTRFDPFHQGATEQDLYDRLPQWIEEIDRGGAALLTLEHRGKVHSAEITLEQMQSPVRAAYQGIVDLTRAVAATGSQPALVLSETLSALPGLQAELEEAVGSEAVILAPAAAAKGALRQQHFLIRLGEHEVDFVAELPIEALPGKPIAPLKSPTKAFEPTSEPSSKPPTHLLHEGVAHPLDSDPLCLGVAVPAGGRGVNLTGSTAGISRRHCSLSRQGDEVIVEDHSTYGTFLNGSRLEGRASLAAGDRLRLGTPGIVLQLIAVE